MTAQPGAPGTAADGYKVTPEPGRHRAPPPVPTPRAPTVIAVAAAVLTAASLTAIVGQAVAPHAHARAAVSTVTRAETITAGPLEMPSVGVVAPAVESLYPTPSAAPQRTVAVSRGTRTGQTAPKPRSAQLVAITTPSEQTVTPAAQPVSADQPTEPTPTAPPADPIAAASSSATPTEETSVTETPVPTVDVDATAEVAP